MCYSLQLCNYPVYRASIGSYLFLFVADHVCTHNHKEAARAKITLKGGGGGGGGGLGVGKARKIRIS